MQKIVGFICGPHEYVFEGVHFEIHSYCGPWPLKKDGDPKARAGKKFFDLYDRFRALSKEEQEKCHLGGGCIPMVTEVSA